uniref:N-terminal methionine N(alpha)-acetyltransferase NatE n=1 Tax=Caenorhabditis tropicalis TaxID=1561998 RepID=A0A1I7TL52_9PELO
MASSSNEPSQVASTQARNEIPENTATRSSLPNTNEKMVALQNHLRIETFDEQNLQQRIRELTVLVNIISGGADDSFYENDHQEVLVRLYERFHFFDNTRGRQDVPESLRIYTRLANKRVTIADVTEENIEIGVMCCIEFPPPHKEYNIMSLGVVQQYERHKRLVIDLFLKHAISTAEKTNDIEIVRYFCKADDTVTMELLNRSGFSAYENSQFFIKPIVKNIPQVEAFDSDEGETDDGQGTSTDGDRSGTNAGRNTAILEIKKRYLHLANVSIKNLPALKQINEIINPADHIQQESIFRNVLEIPELTFLAYFDVYPCGYITCQKVSNHDGSSHLSIVTLGVTPDRRGFGIGEALLRRAIKVANEMADVKFLTAIVPANKDSAERLFKRHHFEQCGGLSEKYGAYQGHIFSKRTGN